jgi:hypothetical protein
MSESATALEGELGEAETRLGGLRHDLAELRAAAGELRGRGSQLVALDLGRSLVALGAADLALQRARRHAGLEEAS